METKILKNLQGAAFEGCDFVVQLPEPRGSVRILQLTDMQIIDAAQRRTPDRLRADEIEAWDPKNFDLQAGDQIRSLVAQARPDLIILTGDLVYGSFDDAGTTMRWFVALMDSFKIPWAPVFGNHDNESAMGVAWQCAQLEASPYCLFKRGSVSGNSNYTVGVAKGDTLLRVLHMLDSNGCHGKDPAIIREGGIYPDQRALMAENTRLITQAQQRAVPAFSAFHIPVAGFRAAEYAKGYRKTDSDTYVIGVDVPAKDRDFGFCLQKWDVIPAGEDFTGFLKSLGVDGVFAGHEHNCCYSIANDGIVWTFGLKTGQYDFHVPYQLGGTLITLEGADFTVQHLPALTHCERFPAGSAIFKDLFAHGEV